MIHYTCDRCRRVIDDGEELRFEVNIVAEVKLGSGSGPGADNGQLDPDLDDLLDHAIDAANEELLKSQRYDLCAECYLEFSRNPLGSEPQVHVGFSEN